MPAPALRMMCLMVSKGLYATFLQVWAMAVGGAGEGLLATGAADATVAIWEDCTAADEEAAAEEEAVVVLQQQELSNALQVGRAAAFAIFDQSLFMHSCTCVIMPYVFTRFWQLAV